MKLILEKADVVRIIGKHFDATLDPDKVIIRTEPEFEIEVSGIPLADSNAEPTNVVTLPPRAHAPSEEAAALKRADDNATLNPPPPGLDGEEATEEGDLHPAAILAKSKELAEKLDRENPHLARQRRGGSTKPPADYRDEL